MMRIELTTSSLPRKCSTPELYGQCSTVLLYSNRPDTALTAKKYLERVMGIEPTLLAWKARVLPLNYTRLFQLLVAHIILSGSNPLRRTDGGGRRIRTSEAYAADLQSAPFDRSGIPPHKSGIMIVMQASVNNSTRPNRQDYN